ncbi:UNVERIFIED_CONTAM: YEATS domain-containing protein 2 [Siphonaria sp. JEL0065]|nr:YEATS domain-containing protein 2 [Siphonaria sp. JEL0065]
MVYVQGPPTNPDITPFISRVRFHLHPDYRPNDVIDVSTPPFQVTRYGWGEFPIRVRLFFVDPRNKTMDLMYSIKLDRFLSGRQVLGGEVWTDLLLDKNTKFRDSLNPGASTSKDRTLYKPNGMPVKKSGFGHSKKRGGYRVRLKPKVDVAAATAISGSVESAASEETAGRQENVEVKEEGEDEEGDEESEEVLSKTMDFQMETEEDVELDSSVVEILDTLIEQFPLIRNENMELELVYPVAESMEAFEGMSETERLTLEEQRASAMLSHAKSQPISSTHPLLQVSVSDIVKWCRSIGYTPTYEESIQTVILNSATDSASSKENVEATNSMQMQQVTFDTQSLPKRVKPIQKYPVCKFCGRRHMKTVESLSSTDTTPTGIKLEEQEPQQQQQHLEEGETLQIVKIAKYCISQIQPSLKARGVGFSSLSVADPLLESARSLKKQSSTASIGSGITHSSRSSCTKAEWDFKAPVRASANDLAFIWSSVAEIGVPVPQEDEEEESMSLQDSDGKDLDDTGGSTTKDDGSSTSSRVAVGGLLYEAMRAFCKRLLKESEAVYREQLIEVESDETVGITVQQAEANGKRKGLLVPVHVRAAALRDPQFDFLTNRCLGIVDE